MLFARRFNLDKLRWRRRHQSVDHEKYDPDCLERPPWLQRSSVPPGLSLSKASCSIQHVTTHSEDPMLKLKRKRRWCDEELGGSPEGVTQDLPTELTMGLSEEMQEELCDQEENPSFKTLRFDSLSACVSSVGTTHTQEEVPHSQGTAEQCSRCACAGSTGTHDEGKLLCSQRKRCSTHVCFGSSGKTRCQSKLLGKPVHGNARTLKEQHVCRNRPELSSVSKTGASTVMGGGRKNVTPDGMPAANLTEASPTSATQQSHTLQEPPDESPRQKPPRAVPQGNVFRKKSFPHWSSSTQRSGRMRREVSSVLGVRLMRATRASPFSVCWQRSSRRRPTFARHSERAERHVRSRANEPRERKERHVRSRARASHRLWRSSACSQAHRRESGEEGGRQRGGGGREREGKRR